MVTVLFWIMSIIQLSTGITDKTLPLIGLAAVWTLINWERERSLTAVMPESWVHAKIQIAVSRVVLPSQVRWAVAASRQLSVSVAGDWFGGGCVVSSGPLRPERKSAEGLLENVPLLTKIKHRKGNSLFPVDVLWHLEIREPGWTTEGAEEDGANAPWGRESRQLARTQVLDDITGPQNYQSSRQPTLGLHSMWDKTLKINKYIKSLKSAVSATCSQQYPNKPLGARGSRSGSPESPLSSS